MIPKARTHGLIGAMLFAVSLSVVVPQPQAFAASDLPSGTTEYLIPEGHPAMADTNIEVVRSLGFGWYLARGPESLLDAGTPSTAQARSRGFDPTGISPNGSYSIASDPLFDQQWGLENIGQDGGTPDADIDILGAWPTSEGGPRSLR